MIVFYSLLLYYLATLLVRVVLAGRELTRVQVLEAQSFRHDLSGITVVQPILSGDPALADNLRRNTSLYPGVEFLWLVDTDDDAGLRIAEEILRPGRIAARILLAPKGSPALNPKMFKLAFAFSEYDETIVILDDDCTLTPGSLEKLTGLLEGADLSTGTPFYAERAGFWSLLLAKFPNGHSILAYFPLLRFFPAQTINGMFYATRRETISRLGGFEVISRYLCDDYELAKLYRDSGMLIRQSSAHVTIRSTISGGVEYVSIMRRWLRFASRQLQALFNRHIFSLVVLPAIIPLLCFGAALSLGALPVCLLLLCMLIKSEAVLMLRRRFFGGVPRVHVALEVASDLALPIFCLLGLWPGPIRWRGKKIVSNRVTLQCID